MQLSNQTTHVSAAANSLPFQVGGWPYLFYYRVKDDCLRIDFSIDTDTLTPDQWHTLATKKYGPHPTIQQINQLKAETSGDETLGTGNAKAVMDKVVSLARQTAARLGYSCYYIPALPWRIPFYQRYLQHYYPEAKLKVIPTVGDLHLIRVDSH